MLKSITEFFLYFLKVLSVTSSLSESLSSVESGLSSSAYILVSTLMESFQTYSSNFKALNILSQKYSNTVGLFFTIFWIVVILKHVQ